MHCLSLYPPPFAPQMVNAFVLHLSSCLSEHGLRTTVCIAIRSGVSASDSIACWPLSWSGDRSHLSSHHVATSWEDESLMRLIDLHLLSPWVPFYSEFENRSIKQIRSGCQRRGIYCVTSKGRVVAVLHCAPRHECVLGGGRAGWIGPRIFKLRTIPRSRCRFGRFREQINISYTRNRTRIVRSVSP